MKKSIVFAIAASCAISLPVVASCFTDWKSIEMNIAYQGANGYIMTNDRPPVLIHKIDNVPPSNAPVCSTRAWGWSFHGHVYGSYILSWNNGNWPNTLTAKSPAKQLT